MRTSVNIQNLKCGGCAKTIEKNLKQLEGISNVAILVEESEIRFDHGGKSQLDLVSKTLKKLGYPISTERNDLQTVARSFVSCSMGKFSKS